MPGAIIAVAMCYWYFQTASKLNLNPLPWIVAALIIYYGVKYGWTLGVAKALFGSKALSPLINDLSGAFFGVLAAALFRSSVLLKQKPTE